MQLFITEAVSAADLPGDMPSPSETILALLASDASAEGTPFVLRADGRYDHLLNRFFGKLAVMGVAAETSRRTYAQQIVLLARYIEDCCGRPSILHGTLDDFESYKAIRRDARDPMVTASSWNTQVAALEKLFQFALQEDLIAALPFRYAHRNIKINGRVEVREVNALYDRTSSDDTVRCLSIDEYEFFRDFGLTGRAAIRDQALAELLVSTGMRITEALVQLREELPPGDAGSGILASEVALARNTTKGLKAREIWVAHRVLRDHVDNYYVTDRADALIRAQRDKIYANLKRPLLADTIDHDAVHVRTDSGVVKTAFGKLTTAKRRRLYLHEAGTPVAPLVLWCSEQGLPLGDAAVRMSFIRACERCNVNGEARRRFGRPMHVTPHTLRHTFAVAYLSQLIRESGLMLRRDLKGAASRDAERLRSTLMDPLDQLRRRLGHRSVETTYKYLTYLDEARGVAFAAVQGWDTLLTRDRDETETLRARS